MKKSVLLLVFAFFVVSVSAQTKNGTVFSEHAKIDATKAMWTAFQNGEAEIFTSHFADSVYRFINGKMFHIPKERFAGNVKWWANNMTNLKIDDAKPASPDAIEYEKGGTWVQDWLRFTAVHPKTGINIDLAMHNLYSFNEEGKITSIHQYFNDAVFEDIANSQTTKENGKVYINHPYINKVRKALNAFAAKDIDAWASYFNPKARFWYSTMQTDEFKTFEESKARLTKQFETQGEVKFEQEGYPDCVYYAISDSYSVYSWWTFHGTKDDKKVKYPLMFTHNFDKDGKINQVFIYFSTNHME
ncbi:MAG: nuclear transport factor 2 family protein [Methylococcales bacterium]|nr:nuclear transport factor 2 family protein [Methylococcales bacterium]